MVVSLIEGLIRSYTDVTIRARDTRPHLHGASVSQAVWFVGLFVGGRGEVSRVVCSGNIGAR
jgi:hypothetical protein